METILEVGKLLILGSLVWLIWELVKMIRKTGEKM